MRRTTAGYTLLELLVVVTVIGILTGVAYLRLGPAFTRAKVRSAAGVMTSDLQQAQMLAVRQRQPIVFAVNLAARSYQVRTRPADTVFIERTFGAGTEYPLDEFTAAPSTVEFFPNGVAGTDASFTVGNQGYRRRVTLTRAGQIRIANAP